MKVRILLIFSFLWIVQPIRAQDQTDRPHSVMLSVGGALAFRTFMAASDPGLDINRDGSALLGLHYDYDHKEKWTLGVHIAYQHFNLTLRDSISLGLLETGSVYKFYAGARLLRRWNDNPSFQLYSGFKMGWLAYWSGEIHGPDAGRSRIERTQNNSRPALGIIPIGFKWYAGERFGMMMESSLGVPGFLMIGGSYKL